MTDIRHPDESALQRYADGDPDVSADAALAEHVDACLECRDAVARARRVSAALALSTTAPEELRARIDARRARGDRVILPIPETPAAHRSRWRMPLAAAAAAAAVLLLTTYRRDPPQPVDAAPKAVRHDVMTAVLDGWRQSTIDSVRAASDDPSTVVELRYHPDAPGARPLADSIAAYVGRSRTQIVPDTSVAAVVITVRH